MSANERGRKAGEFYVDPTKGDDGNDGSIGAPFQTIDQALQTVSDRVESGVRSDTIYLRGGVYRKVSDDTLYMVNLRGTPENYSLLSAMPADPNAPGAVQRKSGRWYEKVVIDDANVIDTPWTPCPGHEGVWQTNPGFVLNNWYENALWPWRGIDTPKEREHVRKFTVAPYMLLQDGEAYLWGVTVDDLTQPGMRTYNQDTDTLYVRTLGGKDPNECKMETWHSGPEKDGKLLLDGEGRAILDGNMLYAGIVGIEFRMFVRLFEFMRGGYEREEDRITQRHVLYEDNFLVAGWIQILLDANCVSDDRPDKIFPRFDDRSNWVGRYNVFLRPAREVFQLHGRDHVFEYNEIIEHGGPWAGPSACVSSVNTRNTLDIQIRYNYIQGQGSNPWHTGSVFMIEVGGEGHGDEADDYRYGGQTYIGNLIVNQTSGPAMFLGKGGTQMRNVTVRGNIFSGHKRGGTILLTSSHLNLRIENNVFHDQAEALEIAVPRQPGAMKFKSLPSTITIRDNIFTNCRKTLSRKLLDVPEDSEIVIERNLFHNNGDEPMGEGIISGDPRFRDPDSFDFRLANGSPAILDGRAIGACEAGEDVPRGTDWWRIAKQSPGAVFE